MTQTTEEQLKEISGKCRSETSLIANVIGAYANQEFKFGKVAFVGILGMRLILGACRLSNDPLGLLDDIYGQMKAELGAKDD